MAHLSQHNLSVNLHALVCGDVLFNAPKLRLPLAFLTIDMDEDKRSIRKVIDLEPEVVCFGHGEPLRGATPILREFGRTIGV